MGLGRLLSVQICLLLIGSFLIQNSYSQDTTTEEPIAERCSGGCVSPARCQLGYFLGRRSTPFRHCCYEEPRRRSYIHNSESGKKLDCRFRQIENFATTEAPADIERLDFSINDLHGKAVQLHDDFLQYFPGLKELAISLTHLSDLPTNFLSSNPNLKHLILSWNSITELPEDLLANNKELTRIDLSGNRISILPKNFFKSTPKLEEILINNNKIKYLTSEHFTPAPNLRSVDVSYNLDLICISPTVFANNRDIAFVRLQDTGFRVPPGLQETYCETTCRHSPAWLKWHLSLYLTARYHYVPGDPCFDPAHWQPDARPRRPLNRHRSRYGYPRRYPGK